MRYTFSNDSDGIGLHIHARRGWKIFMTFFNFLLCFCHFYSLSLFSYKLERKYKLHKLWSWNNKKNFFSSRLLHFWRYFKNVINISSRGKNIAQLYWNFFLFYWEEIVYYDTQTSINNIPSSWNEEFLVNNAAFFCNQVNCAIF